MKLVALPFCAFLISLFSISHGVENEKSNVEDAPVVSPPLAEDAAGIFNLTAKEQTWREWMGDRCSGRKCRRQSNEDQSQPAHPPVHPQQDKSQGTVVPIDLCGDDYVGHISFGAERAKFRVKFDSSADYLMVFDQGLGEDQPDYFSTSGGQCRGKAKFFGDDEARSKTMTGRSQSFEEAFPDSSVIHGTTVAQETVKLGGTETKNVDFVLAFAIDDSNSDAELSNDVYATTKNTDVVFGLSGTRSNRKSDFVSPPVIELLGQNDLPSNTVLFYLAPSPTSGKGSHVAFGALAHRKDLIVPGKEVQHHGLVADAGHTGGHVSGDGKWWEVPVRNVNLDELDFSKKEQWVASIETAQSVVSLPTDVFNAIIKATDADAFGDQEQEEEDKLIYHALCTKVRSMNALTFEIGTGSTAALYTLDGYELSVEDQPDEIENNDKEVMCKLLIEGNGSNDKTMGLGHPFLRKYYTGFSFMTTSPSEGQSGRGQSVVPTIAVAPSKAYAEWKTGIERGKREKDAAGNWGREAGDKKHETRRGGKRRQGKKKRHNPREDEPWPSTM